MLVDIGSTLWPVRGPLSGTDDNALRLNRLRAAPPVLSQRDATALRAALGQGVAQVGGQLTRDIDGIIGAALRQVGVESSTAASSASSADLATRRLHETIRDAMCLPAVGVRFFPGAQELLQEIKRAGLRCVILSNTIWRNAAAYQRDFAAMGATAWIDAVVTSLDVGYWKPHPAIFEVAVRRAYALDEGDDGAGEGAVADPQHRSSRDDLTEADLPASTRLLKDTLIASGCDPSACAMIGNNERSDILPALTLGMHTIRVAIEEPIPSSTRAHSLATTLPEATSLLRAWISASTPPPRKRMTGPGTRARSAVDRATTR